MYLNSKNTEMIKFVIEIVFSIPKKNSVNNLNIF